MTRKSWTWAGSAAATLLIVGCGGSDGEVADGTVGAPLPSVGAPEATPGDNPTLSRPTAAEEDLAPGERAVSSTDIDPWPLTVEGGVLRCEGDGEVTFLAPTGETYAVNETAAAAQPDLPGIEEITDTLDGVEVGMEQLTGQGEGLC